MKNGKKKKPQGGGLSYDSKREGRRLRMLVAGNFNSDCFTSALIALPYRIAYRAHRVSAHLRSALRKERS